MQTFRGTVRVRQVNPGSKSEGRAAWLETVIGSKPKSLRLYRSDMPEVGDPLFADLDGRGVTVKGKKEASDYLRVDSLTVDGIPEENISNNEETVKQ